MKTQEQQEQFEQPLRSVSPASLRVPEFFIPRTQPYKYASPTLLFSISCALFPCIPCICHSYVKHTGGIPPARSQDLRHHLNIGRGIFSNIHRSSNLRGLRLCRGRACLCPSLPGQGDTRICKEIRAKEKGGPGENRLFIVFSLEHVPARRSGPGVGE
jgi:hypothetical protein